MNDSAEAYDAVSPINELDEALQIPVEAYISEAYARAERDRLWRRVWLQVGRVEEIPDVGSCLTYEILDDSVVVVRTTADQIKAFHNVCMHRGRRLVDTPPGARNACRKSRAFVCPYHGWTFSTISRRPQARLSPSSFKTCVADGASGEYSTATGRWR